MSHPDRVFPDLGADAPCPLCQQPLAEGALRLQRFEAFIQQEAERNFQTRRVALESEYRTFAAHAPTLNFDDLTYGEIEALDPQTAIVTRTFDEVLSARHQGIRAAIESLTWAGIETELTSPAARLSALAEALSARADELEKASEAQSRTEMQREFGELDARVRLIQVEKAVLRAVFQLQHQAKLSQCIAALRTTAISVKAAELTSTVVSKGLAEALNREFNALGVSQLRVSLESRSEKGKVLHWLALKLSQNCLPRDILSEGEQRAVALSYFFAEVGLRGGHGGIIFDDPVSSLDHRRRERVARRLAVESAQRQVIVLTHDIYFLSILMEAAKAAGVPISTSSLTRARAGFGVVDPELPFEGKNTLKRIGALKAQHQLIEKLYQDGQEAELRRQTDDAYVRLRKAWERAIEEVLLRMVVVRFRNSVETQRLVEVMVDDEDFSKVKAGMSTCSKYAHDAASQGGLVVREPQDLLADINALAEWRDRVEQRSKETAKRRKG